MAEEYPLVSKWATFFLYPFSFSEAQENAFHAAVRKPTRRWQQYQLEDQQEVGYFLPYTNDFLCQQVRHFEFSLPEKHSLEVSQDKDVSPKLVNVRLHCFPLGVGVLALRIEGTVPLPFDKLLYFNSVFRYLDAAYKDQPLYRIVLRGESEPASQTPQPQSGLGPLMPYFFQEIEKVPDSPLRDNRLVVYSYAALDRGAIPESCNLNDLFFKFLFVDRIDEALPDANFRHQLLEKHEYRRWQSYVHDGTSQSVRFGFSRYSGVVMGLESETDPTKSKDFFKDDIFQHFTTMYYDMALILLFHRTALLSLSNALSKVVEEKSREEWQAEVRELRQHALEFTNRYWFGEITNQDQGIEMFDCWRNALRTQELFDEVHRELQEYDDDLRNRDAARLNNTLAVLTAGTYLFLPLALTTYVLAVLKESYRIPLSVPLLLFFIVLSALFIRKSAAVWEFFRDLSDSNQTFRAVCEEHGKRFVNSMWQVYKRVTGC